MNRTFGKFRHLGKLDLPGGGEALTAEGLTLIERRNCMELFRDQAAERFEVQIGSPWRPRAGSLVSHRTLTAAMIDSRDFIAAPFAWRFAQGRRVDRRQMGHPAQGAADCL
jgi:hypothetical protein